MYPLSGAEPINTSRKPEARRALDLLLLVTFHLASLAAAQAVVVEMFRKIGDACGGANAGQRIINILPPYIVGRILLLNDDPNLLVFA